MMIIAGKKSKKLTQSDAFMEFIKFRVFLCSAAKMKVMERMYEISYVLQ